MAKQLRLEVVIDKGREMIELPKLSKIIAEVQQFFAMLSSDCGIADSDTPWVGLDFRSGSLEFTAERPVPVPDDQASKFITTFRSILENAGTDHVKKTTLLQYAKIA